MRRRTPEQTDRHHALVLASIWLASMIIVGGAFAISYLNAKLGG